MLSTSPAPATRNHSSSAPSAPTPHALIEALVQNIARAFVGKDHVIRQSIMVLVSGGHLLLEDVPGVGKTLLAKAIAKSLSAQFRRIQFTADLLPSDITGLTIFSQQSHDFILKRGPIFTNILLADEINRATPRTQSSLLEAMEETKVTIEGTEHLLPPPFFVMATQNPVELEGTYPLPFAQMDRFMARLSIGYMTRESEVGMLRAHHTQEPLDLVEPLMDIDTLLEIQKAAAHLHVEDLLLGYLVDLVQATRKTDGIEYGASPRASLDIQHYARSLALTAGRNYVLPDDIKAAALIVLPHRLIIRKGTRSVSMSATAMVEHIVSTVAVPI